MLRILSVCFFILSIPCFSGNDSKQTERGQYPHATAHKTAAGKISRKIEQSLIAPVMDLTGRAAAEISSEKPGRKDNLLEALNRIADLSWIPSFPWLKRLTDSICARYITPLLENFNKNAGTAVAVLADIQVTGKNDIPVSANTVLTAPAELETSRYLFNEKEGGKIADYMKKRSPHKKFSAPGFKTFDSGSKFFPAKFGNTPAFSGNKTLRFQTNPTFHKKKRPQ
ncbi:MAG: hypothetical protein ABIG11_02860 [bacterium]